MCRNIEKFIILKPPIGISLPENQKRHFHMIETPAGKKTYPSILVYMLYDPQITHFYWRERSDRHYKGKLSSAKIKFTH